MIFKIDDKCYIDFDKIIYIDKQAKLINICFSVDKNAMPVTIRSNTKIAKQFFKKLDEWLGIQ